MVTRFVWMIQAFIALLIVSSWITPRHLLQWRISVVVLELGHWLALLALAICVVRPTRGLVVTGVLLACVLMIPAFRASRLDQGFSWIKLWLPGFAATAKLDSMVYFESNGQQLNAQVYRPLQPQPAKPWLLMIHAGGWDSGSEKEFASWHRELATLGHVTIAIEYRLAPKHPWPAQREDVLHAVQWAKLHALELGIDPKKMVLMGRSAGGQIATACFATQPELGAKGCISFYGPVDLEFAHKFSYEDDILGALTLLRNYLGGDPANAAENYRTSSAINYVTQDTPPVLLMHGTRDSLVWVLQSRRYQAQFIARGIASRCTYIELPWGVHGFDFFPSSPDGQLSLHAVVRYLSQLTG